MADIAELNLPKTCQLDFPDPDDLLNFRLIICPDEVCMLHVWSYWVNVHCHHMSCMLPYMGVMISLLWFIFEGTD